MPLTPGKLKATVDAYLSGIRDNLMSSNQLYEWWKTNRSELNVKIPHPQKLETLIKRGLSRGECEYCSSLGHMLCHCSLAGEKTQKTYFDMGRESNYLYLGYPAPLKTIRVPLHYGNSFFGTLGPFNSVEIDKLVDHLLLDPGDIIIEASL